MDWHGAEQGFDAGPDGGEGEAGGRDIQMTCAVAQEPAPVQEPAEAALDHSAALKHRAALLLGVALDLDQLGVDNAQARLRPAIVSCRMV